MDALYARVSLDKTGEVLSVARQQDDCSRLLAAGHMTFYDNSISATTGKHREGYQALLRAIRAGQVKRVVVWRQDRIWRNRRERAEGIELFRQHKVSLICAQGLSMDLSTASGRMVCEIQGAVDTQEVEAKGERQVLANAQRARMGKPVSGPKLFGYSTLKEGFAPIPDEAKEVKAMFRAFLGGASLYSLAARYGITPLLVRRRLINPTYAGIRVRDGVEYQGQWKAIVSPEQWRACVALLSARRKPGRPATALLTGIARCSCGATVFAGVGDNRPTYRCRNGHARQWVREWVDDLVMIYTETLLNEPGVTKKFNILVSRASQGSEDHEALRAEAENLRAGLVTAASDLFKGVDIREQVESARARLAEIEATLNATLDPTDAEIMALVNSRSPWKTFLSWSSDVQRACLRRLWTICLTPAPSGQPRDVRVYQNRCISIKPAWLSDLETDLAN